MMPKRAWTARAISAIGLGWCLRRLMAWEGVLTLAYHRIGTPGDSPFDHDVYSASAENFEHQLRVLKSHCDVIHPRDLADVRRRGKGRHAIITFDDGYRDNYTVALPILRSLGVTATFFVCTGYVDNPRAAWWDETAWMLRRSRRETIDLRPWLPVPLSLAPDAMASSIRQVLFVLKKLTEDKTASFLHAIAEATGSGRCPDEAARENWMTWPMIRELHADGMAIGGHTVRHPILARCDVDRQRQEITECGRRLREEIGASMRWFAYPRGKRDSFTAETKRCLADAGVEWAFSYYGGLQRLDQWDPYDVPRASVELEVNRPQFQVLVDLPQVYA